MNLKTIKHYYWRIQRFRSLGRQNISNDQGESTITYVNGVNEAKNIEKDINLNKLCNIKYLNIKNKFILT